MTEYDPATASAVAWMDSRRGKSQMNKLMCIKKAAAYFERVREMARKGEIG